jgi:hypothetical protein
MKHIILAIILALCSTACNNSSKTTTVEADQHKSSPKLFDEESMKAYEIKSSLSKTTPFTESEFRKAFPKSINGLLLDGKINIVKQQAIGKYGNGSIELSIHDCAGTNSGMASLFFITYKNKAQDDEQTQYFYKERNGIKTIASYRMDKDHSTIIFLYQNRWYVILKADNMNPDKLWDSFDIKALENFKN